MPQHCQLDSCRLRYFAGRLDADGHLVSNTWTPTPKQGDKLRPGTPAAAAALPREDAGQQLLSQPQSRGCNPLHAIRDVLHVSSFLASSVDAALLLGHWLSHYIYGLGVVPSHLHLIVLRNSSSSSDATGHAAVLSQLRRHAIDPESQVRVLDNVLTYTDKLKLDVVNDWLHALPLDAWALFADSDEFFSFPCGLGEELRNATTITPSSACQRPKHGGGHAGVMPCADRIYCARMKDRLAIDGTIAPLKPSPDVSVQYPWECGLRQTLSSNPSKGQFNTLKTALFKAWPASSSSRGVMTGKGEPRQFRNPHSLVNEYRTQSAWTCHLLGSYAHYTLTEAAWRSARQKYRAHLADAARERVYIEARGGQNASHPLTLSTYLRDVYNGSTRQVSDASIVCGLARRLGEPCPDYALLLLFMENQQRDPSRDVSQICEAPEADSLTARGP